MLSTSVIEVATHVRRRESIGATAQADATADDGEADDGSVSTTARADESDGEAEAVLSTSDRSGDACAAARVLGATAQVDATADDGEADDGSVVPV